MTIDEKRDKRKAKYIFPTGSSRQPKRFSINLCPFPLSSFDRLDSHPRKRLPVPPAPADVFFGLVMEDQNLTAFALRQYPGAHLGTGDNRMTDARRTLAADQQYLGQFNCFTGRRRQFLQGNLLSGLNTDLFAAAFDDRVQIEHLLWESRRSGAPAAH